MAHFTVNCFNKPGHLIGPNNRGVLEYLLTQIPTAPGLELLNSSDQLRPSDSSGEDVGKIVSPSDVNNCGIRHERNRTRATTVAERVRYLRSFARLRPQWMGGIPPCAGKIYREELSFGQDDRSVHVRITCFPIPFTISIPTTENGLPTNFLLSKFFFV